MTEKWFSFDYVKEEIKETGSVSCINKLPAEGV